MRPFFLALLTAAALPAAVILNQPEPYSGFFDGHSDYYSFDGAGLINGVGSAALPAANGLTAQRIFGDATLAAGQFSPYIVMVAEGSASGTFTVDTRIAVQFQFSAPGLASEIPFYVQGEIGTSNGFYYTETTLFSQTGGNGTTAFLAKNGYIELIPSGTEVYSWRVSVGAGAYGSSSGLQNLTLSIPANSIELVAFTDGSAPPSATDVPEPAGCLLTATGLVLLLTRRLRHPV